MILLALALVLAGVLLALHFMEGQWGHFAASEESGVSGIDEVERQTVWYNGQKYVLREGVETLLLMGLDTFENTNAGASYNNNERADFLMLLLIDRNTEICTSLHIDRDSMAEITTLGVAGQVTGTEYAQLALAHAYGSGGQDSCRNTVKAVSGFLYNTPIDHYLSMTMDAVQILNDEVGGVTVTIMDDMTAVDESFVKGAQITLRGEQALKYVRSRTGLENSTNRRRMERQRQYMDALYAKMAQRIATDGGFGMSTLLKLSTYTVSDCTASQLSDLLDEASAYEFVGIDAIEGESVAGENFMEFYPDEGKLQELILELFYEPQD